MKSKTIRRWSFIHTWTSLICTVFLLLLALTGLPLMFHHEIDHLLGNEPELAADARRHAAAEPASNWWPEPQAHRPGEVMQYLAWDEDDPNGVIAIMAATAGTEPNSSHTFMLDARTGESVEMPSANGGFTLFLLRLHVDMFAGLPGKLLLAFMGVLFVLAIISGTRAVPAVHAPLEVRHRAPGQIHPPALARPAQPDRRGHPDLGAGGGRDRRDQRLRRPDHRRVAQRQPQRDDRTVPAMPRR